MLNLFGVVFFGFCSALCASMLFAVQVGFIDIVALVVASAYSGAASLTCYRDWRGRGVIPLSTGALLTRVAFYAILALIVGMALRMVYRIAVLGE